jgi:hypothetical protein
LTRENIFANKKYRFCQELEKFNQKNIGFAKKEKILVFTKDGFCQDL